MCGDKLSFLVDANVLIDFNAVDSTVLRFTVDHLGSVIVLSSTLQKVDGLSARDCMSLGLQLEDPTTEELAEAAPRQAGLALDDRLCIAAAIRRGCTCVTNDRKLRHAIEERGGPCLWGLQIVLQLVAGRHMDKTAARRVANGMHGLNPGFIGVGLVRRFEEKLDAMH